MRSASSCRSTNKAGDANDAGCRRRRRCASMRSASKSASARPRRLDELASSFFFFFFFFFFFSLSFFFLPPPDRGARPDPPDRGHPRWSADRWRARRLAAVTDLGWSEIPVHVAESRNEAAALVRAEMAGNVDRKIGCRPRRSQSRRRSGRSKSSEGATRNTHRPFNLVPIRHQVRAASLATRLRRRSWSRSHRARRGGEGRRRGARRQTAGEGAACGPGRGRADGPHRQDRQRRRRSRRRRLPRRRRSRDLLRSRLRPRCRPGSGRDSSGTTTHRRKRRVVGALRAGCRWRRRNSARELISAPSHIDPPRRRPTSLSRLSTRLSSDGARSRARNARLDRRRRKRRTSLATPTRSPPRSGSAPAEAGWRGMAFCFTDPVAPGLASFPEGVDHQLLPYLGRAGTHEPSQRGTNARVRSRRMTRVERRGPSGGRCTVEDIDALIGLVQREGRVCGRGGSPAQARRDKRLPRRPQRDSTTRRFTTCLPPNAPEVPKLEAFGTQFDQLKPS